MRYIIGTFLLLSTLAFGVGMIWKGIYADYEWNNTAKSYWNLADKASTIQAKADYIDKFLSALKGAELADNNALIYKTADNNCANNVQAVSTLRDRLNEVRTMKVDSFEYQQAIQQITAQEQGEASALLDELNGCWMKANHYYLWNGWYMLGAFLLFWVLLFISIVIFSL
jgi:hypothetical protein